MMEIVVRFVLGKGEGDMPTLDMLTPSPAKRTQPDLYVELEL